MKNKDVEFFKVLKEKIRNQPNLKSFFKAPGVDTDLWVEWGSMNSGIEYEL
ncbi:hypothetical protein T05_13274 [Trichinella murrelli]|uniref:Uncharacterized protein n=1 Tax=Trichinella murrelli TaxID=144512 RepID=A0A0V0STV9_9BILA|nr:hypothetical protein T05_13274 [Trichinella murrelli]